MLLGGGPELLRRQCPGRRCQPEPRTPRRRPWPGDLRLPGARAPPPNPLLLPVADPPGRSPRSGSARGLLAACAPGPLTVTPAARFLSLAAPATSWQIPLAIG